jgi:CheY-like chemotaxis protein
LDVAAQLHRTGARTRLVIVTTFARSGYLRRALDAGMSGYVLKDAPIDQLVDTVRRVHAGERVVDPALAVAAWDGADPMTDRERDVLRLAADGLPNTDIAAGCTSPKAPYATTSRPRSASSAPATASRPPGWLGIAAGSERSEQRYRRPWPLVPVVDEKAVVADACHIRGTVFVHLPVVHEVEHRYPGAQHHEIGDHTAVAAPPQRL